MVSLGRTQSPWQPCLLRALVTCTSKLSCSQRSSCRADTSDSRFSYSRVLLVSACAGEDRLRAPLGPSVRPHPATGPEGWQAWEQGKRGQDGARTARQQPDETCPGPSCRKLQRSGDGVLCSPTRGPARGVTAPSPDWPPRRGGARGGAGGQGPALCRLEPVLPVGPAGVPRAFPQAGGPVGSALCPPGSRIAAGVLGLWGAGGRRWVAKV